MNAPTFSPPRPTAGIALLEFSTGGATQITGLVMFTVCISAGAGQLINSGLFIA